MQRPSAPRRPRPRDRRSPAQSTTPPAAPRFRYTVTDLGTLGGDTSRANGLNNNGQVVGEARVPVMAQTHPFLWDSTHGMQDLGGLGGVYYVGSDRAGSVGSANAINDAGQVVGAAYTRARDTVSQQHAFLWEAGRGMQDLGTLGGNESEANGINSKGQVVGFSRSWSGHEPHAFLWDATVGCKTSARSGENPKTSEAHGINDIGQVVGRRLCLWPRLAVGVGPRNARPRHARGANEYGLPHQQLGPGYGQCRHSQTVDIAFLWDAGRGMQDLGTLRPADNWVWVSGINNAGVVVGNSCRDCKRMKHLLPSYTNTEG